jgi:CheY-like chemotaxis protein
MNLALPFLICDENEEVRLLIKTMLSKHGYFHLLEAQNTLEALQSLNEKQFLLIHKKLINDEMKIILAKRKNFIIFSPSQEQETIDMAAHFGVKHVVSFPYSSKSLVEKINSLVN